MNIAIVEDMKDDAEILRGFINCYAKKYNEFCSINTFKDGEEFLSSYKSQFDIIFMDVEMPYNDGFDISARLRQIDKCITLVFVTRMKQYAINGYTVSAFDYLVKPLTYDVFEFHFKRIIEKTKANISDEIVVRSQGNLVRIKVRDIDYVESANHMITFHMGEHTVQVWKTMKEVVEMLGRYRFVMCNSFYLVSLIHIKMIKGENVVVGNAELKISRSKKKDFIKQLTETTI